MWDSALDRRELGEAIASRFDGTITYYDQPANGKAAKRKREQFRSSAVLDWATLHPVERLELLTTHDLARQEKQKLELLRNLLSYYHYAASESREEALARRDQSGPGPRPTSCGTATAASTSRRPRIRRTSGQTTHRTTRRPTNCR